MKHNAQFSLAQNTKRIEAYKTKSDSYWQNEGQENALCLFHHMAEHVPAYKDFLKKHKIIHEDVKNISDFQKVPVIDKENYIDVYPLHELCWEGNIATSYMLSASSGSTGKAYFWPRSVEQNNQGASISEALYREICNIQHKKTLYIVAFAMGTWVAGTYMMMATQAVAEQGYPLTVVTPGLNKEEIIRLVAMGKTEYERVILVGYPPFIKDVIDFGIHNGVDWKSIPIQFLFSGEAITEGWRDHLQTKTGFNNIYTDAINIYGSADVGLVAHETPVSISLRRSLIQQKDIAASLLNTDRIPAMYQYDPSLRYFEAIQNELIITAPSGVPLCRYNTKDVGGILWYQDFEEYIQQSSINTVQGFWKLPIVYLFSRSKFMTSIYGANIYPEQIKLIVEHDEVIELLTGKFILETLEDEGHDQQLVLRVELKENVLISEHLINTICNLFLEIVPKVNSEYKNNLNTLQDRVYPNIVLYKYGDQNYFPKGIIKKLS